MSDFPDYEAARKVIRTWFDGTFAGDHVVAGNIVNAALGDKPLYRIPEHISEHARKNLDFCIRDEVLVQVWPKRDDDDQ